MNKTERLRASVERLEEDLVTYLNPAEVIILIANQQEDGEAELLTATMYATSSDLRHLMLKTPPCYCGLFATTRRSAALTNPGLLNPNN